MRMAAMMIAFLTFLTGCALQSSVVLDVERVAQRQLPLLHVWEIDLRVENRTGEPIQVNPEEFLLVDSTGESHRAGLSATMAGLGLAPVVTLPKGQSTETRLVFTLPAHVVPAELQHSAWGVTSPVPGQER